MQSSEQNPWEKVADSTYFRRVLGNMVAAKELGAKEELGVRFGLTGAGHAPHYQVEAPSGERACFNGLNHKHSTVVDDAFAPHNLSDQAFTYAEVQQMLKRIA
jgi:hypothetical protein